MALESKNRRRKRMRYLVHLGRQAARFELDADGWRRQYYGLYHKNLATERQLVELSRQYLEVCRALNETRPEEKKLIIPAGNWRVPS